MADFLPTESSTQLSPHVHAKPKLVKGQPISVAQFSLLSQADTPVAKVQCHVFSSFQRTYGDWIEFPVKWGVQSLIPSN